MPPRIPRTDPKQPEKWKLIRSVLEKIIEAGEVRKIRQPIVREFQKGVREKQKLKKAGIETKGFVLLGAEQKLTLMACFAGQLVLWNRGHQDSEEKIAAHCREEMALFEQGYDKVILGVTLWGKYRNLIRWLIQKNWIQINEINSFERERPDSKTGKPKVRAEYYTEAYLKTDKASSPAKKSAKSQSNPEEISEPSNAEKSSKPRPVVLLPLLREYGRLLESNDPYELAIAIMGVTGRRLSEVIGQGEFERAGEYQLAFTEPYKPKNRERLKSPTLLPAQQVLEGIERIRKIPEIVAVQNKVIRVINSNLNPTINERMYQLFQETGLIGVLENESQVTVYRLRGIYGEIATHFFCPTRRQFTKFLNEKLGHVKTAGSRSKTPNHYFCYQVVDETLKPIETIGVKLTSLGERYPSEVTRLLTSSEPYEQITALVAASGLYPHELLGMGRLTKASPHHLSYSPPQQGAKDPGRKIPLIGESDRVWEIRQSLMKTLPEVKEKLKGRELDEILESKAQRILKEIEIPSFHALRLYHLDHTLKKSAENKSADPKAIKPENVTQLQIYAKHLILFEKNRGEQTQPEMFGEILETYIQTRERNDLANPENRQQESTEPNQSLEKIKQLEAEINQLKLEKGQVTQQNSQLLIEKRAIEQESEKLQSQIDQQTQRNQDLSAQIAQASVEPVQPIDPVPVSLPETASPPAPVSNDLSKVLEGLQTLAAALQQWQGQSAPGDSAIANSPSRVSPQSEPPTAAVETSPVPIAIAQPSVEVNSVPIAIAQPSAEVNSVPPAIAQADVERVSQGSDRSPIVYNYLEQQINTIIDRLMSFNDQRLRQREKWYITLNLFRDADLTHSLKSLKKVFSDRKFELAAHHQRHRLNHSQNRGHDAQEFKKQFADDWTNLY